MTTPAIDGRGLEKTYTGDEAPAAALRGVDVAIEHGELVAVMGPSGCGKSTLLHALGGLVRPIAGEVLLHGESLWTMSEDARADVRSRRIGFVFQLFNLIPVLTAEENVALPAQIAGIPERVWRPSVDKLLADVGLTERRRTLPSRLSGGEQQRAWRSRERSSCSPW